MNTGMLKAWLIGVAILVAVFALWIIFLQMEVFSQSLAVLLWVSPFIAAFICAYLAPSRKLFLGISMALPSALLAVALNSGFAFFGSAVDFPGVEGGFTLFFLVLAASAVVCVLGAVAGSVLTRNAR